jgi:predicted nuclease of predicted toxin-antitoxin system
MGYRILADENVERATVNSLRKLGHDVERLDDVAELGLGAEDESIARYAREHDRLILTQDDDFFTELDVRTMSPEFAHVVFTNGERLIGVRRKVVCQHAPFLERDCPVGIRRGAQILVVAHLI